MNPATGTSQIPTVQLLRKVDLKSGSLYIDCCVSPDPLSPTPSASLVTKTPVLQSAGPSASVVQTVESPENKERDHDDPETATEGDIQTEYSSDGLCSPHIAVTPSFL